MDGVSMIKTLRALTATAVFLLILAVVYVAHVRLFTVDVVFYAAIADALIAAALAAVILVVSGYFRPLSGLEKSQLVLIWLLAGYAFAISVPTVIDRSLSVYILEKIDQRGGGIRLEGFPEVFTREYMVEHRLVDIRLTEQLESGTIVIDDGCVKLTDKGRTVALASRFFRQHLLPRQRLIMGEYTADLTDPFRNSEPIDSYRCP
jgi:hypothetical protein